MNSRVSPMEIIYVKKGRGTVTAASRKYPVMAGSIMPILPGELHAIDGDPGVRMEYENIIFSLSLLDNQVLPPPDLRGHRDARRGIRCP